MAAVVYDSSDAASFEAARALVAGLGASPGGEGLPVVFVAAKSDKGCPEVGVGGGVGVRVGTERDPAAVACRAARRCLRLRASICMGEPRRGALKRFASFSFHQTSIVPRLLGAGSPRDRNPGKQTQNSPQAGPMRGHRRGLRRAPTPPAAARRRRGRRAGAAQRLPVPRRGGAEPGGARAGDSGGPGARARTALSTVRLFSLARPWFARQQA